MVHRNALVALHRLLTHSIIAPLCRIYHLMRTATRAPPRGARTGSHLFSIRFDDVSVRWRDGGVGGSRAVTYIASARRHSSLDQTLCFHSSRAPRAPVASFSRIAPLSGKRRQRYQASLSLDQTYRASSAVRILTTRMLIISALLIGITSYRGVAFPYVTSITNIALFSLLPGNARNHKQFANNITTVYRRANSSSSAMLM